MEIKLLTLRYSPELGTIDDAPLTALARTHEVLELREHFFVVHGVPHLLCVVHSRRRGQPVARPGPERVAAPPPPPSSTPAGPLTQEQHQLADALRGWRATQAERDGVPRYVVLTNKDIDALVRRRPDSLTSLRRVPGIGKAKLTRHGETLLELLKPGSGQGPMPAPEAQP